MSAIGWLLFGLLVAWFVRVVIPGRHHPLGVGGTTALGVIGALLSGWFAQAFGWYGREDETLGFVISAAGAVLAISIYYGWARRRDILRPYERRWHDKHPPSDKAA